MNINHLQAPVLLALYDEVCVLFCQKSAKKPSVNIINAIFEGINVFQEYHKECDIADVASHLVSSVLKEKPFPLHNKRMALLMVEVFLNINDFYLGASDPFFVIKIKDFDAKVIDEKDFALWLKRHIQKKEKKVLTKELA